YLRHDVVESITSNTKQTAGRDIRWGADLATICSAAEIAQDGNAERRFRPRRGNRFAGALDRPERRLVWHRAVSATRLARTARASPDERGGPPHANRAPVGRHVPETRRWLAANEDREAAKDDHVRRPHAGPHVTDTGRRHPANQHGWGARGHNGPSHV